MALRVGAALYVGFFLPDLGGLPLIAMARIAWTRAGPADLGIVEAPNGRTDRGILEDALLARDRR